MKTKPGVTRSATAAILLVALSMLVIVLTTRCAGPFLEYSSIQEVAPDRSVKAFLVGAYGESLQLGPPFNGLRFEAAGVGGKPSSPIKSTDGEFVGLRWNGPRNLLVTGRRMDKALTATPLSVDYWQYGTFHITFVNLREDGESDSVASPFDLPPKQGVDTDKRDAVLPRPGLSHHRPGAARTLRRRPPKVPPARRDSLSWRTAKG